MVAISGVKSSTETEAKLLSARVQLGAKAIEQESQSETRSRFGGYMSGVCSCPDRSTLMIGFGQVHSDFNAETDHSRLSRRSSDQVCMGSMVLLTIKLPFKFLISPLSAIHLSLAYTRLRELTRYDSVGEANPFLCFRVSPKSQPEISMVSAGHRCS